MATRGRGGRTGSRVVPGMRSTSVADDSAPLCAHNEPAIRLETKNGQNRGRFFWKCNKPVISDKCRFFKWDDSGGPGQQGAGGSQVTAGSPSTSGPFRGQGQSISNTGAANGYSQGGTSSAATQRSTPAPPSSPGKRRRIEVEDDEDDDEDATQHSTAPAIVDHDSYSSHPLRQSRPPQGGSSSKPSSSQPIILSQQRSQTAEEAIEEDWDEDIEDFDDFEAGGTGKKPKLGEPGSPSRRFTSFSGPPTTPTRANGANTGSNAPITSRIPSTPPKQLAPGLPLTPDTGNTKLRSVTPHGITKWQQIREDTSSPFHARANALLNGGRDGAAADVSPQSASTASLLAHDRSDPSIDAARHQEPSHIGYKTPSKTLLPEDTTSPSKSARSASAHISEFSNMLLTDLESLAKQSESMERQLKAAKQKAAYHEKREKDAQTELAQTKEKLKLFMAENERLKMMVG